MLKRNDLLNRAASRVTAELLEPRRLLATITVTGTGDTIAVDGVVTLREAIDSVNSNFNVNADVVPTGTYFTFTPDTINFAIPGTGVKTINVLSQLPLIGQPVVIDGYSQPGASANTLAVGTDATLLIELNGASAGSVYGLYLDTNSDGSTIKGLIINRFGFDGIQVQSGSNTIEGNYVGTDSSGSVDLGNAGNGIDVGESDNTIGGLTAAARNVISGNGDDGINIATSSGNVVQNNYIGVDASGTAELGNDSNGVYIIAAADNTIGGTVAAARNVISGNGIHGVFINDTASVGNKVQGNYIGTNATGTSSLGNTLDGVNANLAETSTISGNLLSGNDSSGVSLNTTYGDPTVVQGNLIGTNAAGTAAIANGAFGVDLYQSGDAQIGGTTAGTRNIIAGNTREGIYAYQSFPHIEGNSIGVDAAGNPLGNGLGGILVSTDSLPRIGGSIAAAGNIIAHNGGPGVVVDSDASALIRLNSIFANTGLGIDLNDNGVTSNDANDADAGGNGLQNFPVLASATSSTGTTVQGSLHSNAGTPFLIDFYSNTEIDPSGLGEGKTYLGSVAVATDAYGNAVFNTTLPITVPAGQFITATATTANVAPNGLTSEFSSAIEVVGEPTTGIEVLLQSELQTLSGGTSKQSNHSGFTGTGFADYAGNGSAVTYATNLPAAQNSQLDFRYANGSSGNRPLQILVNNVLVGTINCPPTGSWTNWQIISLPAVQLPSGAVSIKAVASTSAGGANFDYLLIKPNGVVSPPPPPPSSVDVTLQGENGTFAGGTYKTSGNAGFTGSGYADYGGVGSALTVSTNLASPLLATLQFRYANGTAVARPLQIFVNNVSVGTINCNPTGGWATWTTVSLTGINLPSGAVSIKAVATASAGGPNVDYVRITG